MNGVRRRLLCRLVLAGAVGGCAFRQPPDFNPAHFPLPVTAAAERMPGRVALRMPDALRDRVHGKADGTLYGLRIHLGRIVEQALLLAINDGFRGGAQRTDRQPATDSGFDATLGVDDVRVQHDSRVLWVLPMLLPAPPFVVGDAETASQLSVEASLFDAQGRAVWSRRYDSGRDVWRRPSFWSSEIESEGLVRMAHEQAWRLARQAVADVREWLAAERNQARQL